MMKEMLTKMTVKELRIYVKENNLQIAKMYELKKDELIEAIIALTSTEIPEDTKEAEIAIANLEAKMDLTQEVEKSEPKKNGWEKIAKKQLTGAYNMFVGGLENILQDYCVEDEEYQNAYRTLCSDSEVLVDEIYSNALNCEYGPGYEGPWGSAPKEMRFAGKEFCREVIIELLKKDGFCGYSQAYPILEEDKTSDEAVADTTISLDPSSKKSHTPLKVFGKYGGKSLVKYECPECKNLMTNEDEYCGECGLHLYHGNDEEYDKMETSRKNITLPYAVDGLILFKYGKDHKYCPICNSRVDWKDSFRFCLFCGQEVK